MTENKRYEVAIYDDKAIIGYCVLDKNRPCHTCKLKYYNVFISTEEGCEIVADLLNNLNDKYTDEFSLRETLQLELQRVEEENKELKKQVNDLQFNKSIGQRKYQRRLSE